MSTVPLCYRPAELLPDATDPRRRPRRARAIGWTLAAALTFVASVATTLALR